MSIPTVMELDPQAIEMTLKIVAELVAVVPFVGQGIQALVKIAHQISENITKINEALVAEKHLSVKACQTIALVAKLHLQQRLCVDTQNPMYVQLAEDCDELQSVATRIANHIAGQVRRDSPHLSRSALRKCGFIRVPYTVRELTEKLKDAEQKFILNSHIQTRLCLTDMSGILHEIRELLYDMRNPMQVTPARFEAPPPYTSAAEDRIGCNNSRDSIYSTSSSQQNEELYTLRTGGNSPVPHIGNQHRAPHRMRSVPNLIPQCIPDHLLHTNVIPTAETGYAPRRNHTIPPAEHRNEYLNSQQLRTQRSMLSLNNQQPMWLCVN